MTIRQWSIPPDASQTDMGNNIDVWRVQLNPEHIVVDRCRRLLSSDELERADRFHFDVHRDRFTICRAALRMILSRYLDQQPTDINFIYGEHQKPGLHTSFQRIEFNVAHSDDLAVIAFSQNNVLGIDVEYMRKNVDYLELASRFFATSESATLARVVPRLRRQTFYNGWTRKESYLKAKGSGLAVPLNSFAVTLAPNDPVKLVQSNAGPREVARWKIISFTPQEEFVGALTAEQGSWTTRGFQFPLSWLS